MLQAKESELKHKESELIKNLNKKLANNNIEKRIKNKNIAKLNLNVPSSIISRTNNNNNNSDNNSDNNFSHNSDRGDYLKSHIRPTIQTDWQSATAPMKSMKVQRNSSRRKPQSIKITKVDNSNQDNDSSSSSTISPINTSTPVLRSYGYLSPKRAMKVLTIESTKANASSKPVASVVENIQKKTSYVNTNNDNETDLLSDIHVKAEIKENNKPIEQDSKPIEQHNEQLSTKENIEPTETDHKKLSTKENIRFIERYNTLNFDERKRLKQLEMFSRTWKNKENFLVEKCMKAEVQLKAIESLEYEKKLAIYSKKCGTLETEYYKVVDELNQERTNHKTSVRALSKELTEKNHQIDHLMAKISALRHQLAQSNAELIRSKDQYNVDNAEQFANSIAKYGTYKSVMEL